MKLSTDESETFLAEEPMTPLFAAIRNADCDAIERLAEEGADLNERDAEGEPALFVAIGAVTMSDGETERERRFKVVRKLVDLGADRHALGLDGYNILIDPVLGLQPGLLADLLSLAIDPNRGCGEPWETVYDAACFDYEYEAWLAPSLPSLCPGEEFRGNEDEYLGWLDREASARGYIRPEMLLMLRRFGAKSGSELAEQLGGSAKQGIRWSDAGWILAD